MLGAEAVAPAEHVGAPCHLWARGSVSSCDDGPGIRGPCLARRIQYATAEPRIHHERERDASRGGFGCQGSAAGSGHARSVVDRSVVERYAATAARF